MREVTWADFLLADVLTSLAKALSDSERAICLLVSHGSILEPHDRDEVRRILYRPRAVSHHSSDHRSRLSACHVVLVSHGNSLLSTAAHYDLWCRHSGVYASFNCALSRSCGAAIEPARPVMSISSPVYAAAPLELQNENWLLACTHGVAVLVGTS